MKIVVISYSYTGNNEALADSVAKELSAEHIRISERKIRTMGVIIMDMIFKRSPQVQPSPDSIKKYDLILFFAPVWMGQVASPLRSYLNYLKAYPHKYGFISISGGADATNPKLMDELKRRTESEPAVLLDLHIVGLIPTDSMPDRKDTSKYRLKEGDVGNLTNKVLKSLKDII